MPICTDMIKRLQPFNLFPPINFNLFHLCCQVADHVGKDASVAEVCHLKLHDNAKNNIMCHLHKNWMVRITRASFWNV